MKTGILETRPIFVRKENRTRGHVFVVSLAYRVVLELQNLWADMDITVQEGIEELTGIDCRKNKNRRNFFKSNPATKEFRKKNY